MKRLRKFLHLPGAQRRLLIKAVLLLEAVKLGLRLLPFKILRQLLTRLSKTSADAPLGVPEKRSPAKDIVRAVEVASLYTPGGGKTCLVQALAAQVLLARRGHPALLHVGVLKDEGEKLQAHAWVESEGEILIGGVEVEPFTPLVALDKEEP